MYVVMTIEELWMNCGLSDTVCDTFGWDVRDLDEEYRGIPWEELKAFEVCMDGPTARRLGLLCPRGEFWIERLLTLPGEKYYAWADLPKRELPDGGHPYRKKLVPDNVASE